MSRTIEVPVPEHLYRLMKLHADEAGVSLVDYVVRNLDEIEATKRRKPTKEQVLEWLAQMTPVDSEFDTAEIIREGREEREEELWQAIRGSFTNDDRR